MKELIKLNTSDNGKRTVSVKELYLGLGLNKAHWSRWYPTNIEKNEFFNEGYDWRGFTIMENGNETMDFEISLEFAKHIAMMARTERSHQYRNYFLVCEEKLKQQNVILPKKSPMELLELEFAALKEQKQEIKVVKEEVKDLKDNMPLFNIDCEELQKAVKKKAVKCLGGYNRKAYYDKSLRARVFGDIQREIKRQFEVNSYKAIKRSQLEIAKEIVDKYEVPFVLKDEITLVNNQIAM
ncbi:MULTISPECIES: ORF6C domain-containing protein [unclassified Clostridium]|uniref:ORF6C domain-containing protein n=1 Tax=unclassified Clostridium TaxID=2614128 RepID=UPI0013FC6663|nr:MULTISPECIES: ORF6C domain-containing protein [unclassified Clostridium]NFR85789.1 hypothetical protein [Clostridium botulinum]NFR91423.1 hypothetical protein [Clostridium botulinum]NFT99320.1 hypothetical protein [Clostridium botulinum]